MRDFIAPWLRGHLAFGSCGVWALLLFSDATPREAIDRLVEAAFDQIRETRTEHTLAHTVWPSVI